MKSILYILIVLGLVVCLTDFEKNRRIVRDDSSNITIEKLANKSKTIANEVTPPSNNWIKK